MTWALLLSQLKMLAQFLGDESDAVPERSYLVQIIGVSGRVEAGTIAVPSVLLLLGPAVPIAQAHRDPIQITRGAVPWLALSQCSEPGCGSRSSAGSVMRRQPIPRSINEQKPRVVNCDRHPEPRA